MVHNRVSARNVAVMCSQLERLDQKSEYRQIAVNVLISVEIQGFDEKAARTIAMSHRVLGGMSIHNRSPSGDSGC